jgi:hypothetical protein
MRTRDLLEKRGRIVKEMRGLVDGPTGESGDLSTEQQQRFDGLKGELSTVERAIEQRQTLDEAERRMQGQTLTGDPDTRFDQELRNFSLVKAIAGQAGMNVDSGREREVSAELARRMGVQPRGIMVPNSVFEKRVLTTALPVAGPART